MNRRHAAAALWTLQWSLAATFFLLGLLEASLPEADLLRLHLAPAAAAPGVAGLIVVPAALSLVIPSVTRFWPGLSPLAGAVLAVMASSGAAGSGWQPADLVLAIGCATVALGRGVLLRIEPIQLGPEPIAPLPRRPAKAPSGPSDSGWRGHLARV
jgi:hypothetical protein